MEEADDAVFYKATYFDRSENYASFEIYFLAKGPMWGVGDFDRLLEELIVLYGVGVGKLPADSRADLLLKIPRSKREKTIANNAQSRMRELLDSDAEHGEGENQ